MKIVAKPLTSRTDFYCLRTNHKDIMDVRPADGDIPVGYLEYVTTNERPALGDGEVGAYHIVVKDDRIEKTRISVTAEEAKKRKYQVPRTFSKLKAVAVLTKAGYWDSCKKFIEDAGLYDLYLAANEFGEDNEYFVQGLGKIQAELGLTDDQVESLLAQMVK